MKIDEEVRDAFTRLVEAGYSPATIADAMARYSSLIIEQLRGPGTTAAGLLAAAQFFADRAQAQSAEDRRNYPTN